MTTKEEGNRGMGDNNRLIAEKTMIAKFMSTEIDSANIGFVNDMLYFVSDMKYDTSWDWLMPVVIKIKSLKFDNLWINMYKDSVVMTLLNLDIQITYAAVTEFITYFNKGKDAH